MPSNFFCDLSLGKGTFGSKFKQALGQSRHKIAPFLATIQFFFIKIRAEAIFLSGLSLGQELSRT